MTAVANAWPQDGWYAVGGSRDLRPGQARAAQLLDHDLACWRSDSGRFHTWRNRCAHRGMRLSFGFVRGEQLRCRYHGWGYDETGQCNFIPAHPNTRPPKAAAIPSYDALEQDGLLWVRLGEGEKAPPSLAAVAPPRGRFQFCQSRYLSRAPEDLVGLMPNLIFLPAALAHDLRRGAWRYSVESRETAQTSLCWSGGDKGGRTVSYRWQNPAPGIYVCTAETEETPLETRLLTLQPMSGTRTALHVMVALEGGDASAARLAAAHWARRLHWFLENDGHAAAAYNPWLQEVCAP